MERAKAARRRRGPVPGPSAGHWPVAGSVEAGDAGCIDPRLLKTALTIRRTEERLLALFAEGRLFGTVHTCIGQEWVGVAVADALRPEDFVFSNHRGHGHYLARTGDLEGLIAEIMGRSTGVCGGLGGSQHLCRDGFFTNGVQGGIMPVSAGLAMARQMAGSEGIAVCFIGDGTLGEGVVYETLNIASKWSLPFLIVVEDNGVAQSTAQTEALAGTIAGRARGFGIEAIEAGTWHPAELIERAGRAAHQVRTGRQPILLHVRTCRLKAHSKGDDDRDPGEIERFAAADPLNQIMSSGDADITRLLSEIDDRIDAAVRAAEAAPHPDVADDSVREAPVGGSLSAWCEVSFEPRRVVDAIGHGLAEAMAADERVVVLGEDVRDPYGGAFKVTAGLSDRFGDRVRNTPISEAAIVGLGNGLALAGYRPVVEIMFGDFLLLAADQLINHAAKFADMYHGQARVPLLVRAPMGGYRGYGPTHSQSLEKHLLGIPGTRVLAVHSRWCPGRLYRKLLATIDRPTLVIENKLLYGRRTDPTPPPGARIEAWGECFPTIRIRPDKPCQLTVVTYGGMVEMVEAALAELREEEELFADLLVPTQLYPLDIEPIVESAAATSRLLLVEEGQGFAAFGSEVIAQVVGDPRVGSLRAERVSAAPCAIPAARPAELQAIPSQDDIVRAAVRLATGL
ncbi:MAG TPA: thiamine pyrophosphate-dependent enzyme [Phycisphaerae bacterium]|nr:thiamine pyrophosphate-dependent enzyme [Phycisphaerae bacterium]